MGIRLPGFALCGVCVIIGGLGFGFNPGPPTYVRDVRPLVTEHCLSCHDSRKSDRRRLDTYTFVNDKIDEIIYRVQLPTNHRKFMPYKMRQAPLTPRQIELLKAWRAGGAPEF